MDTITRINGNGQPYTTDLPKIVCLTKHINDVALAHIKENTGLDFTVGGWGNYEAQPTGSWQVAALIMTYDFKTRYYNNASNKNTLFLKLDHHVGFDVDSICPDCANHNGIRFANELESDRLAC
jgi:hypothetical protein